MYAAIKKILEKRMEVKLNMFWWLCLIIGCKSNEIGIKRVLKSNYLFVNCVISITLS